MAIQELLLQNSISSKQYARYVVSLDSQPKTDDDNEDSIDFLVANCSHKPDESIISHLIYIESNDIDSPSENLTGGHVDKFSYLHDAGEILSLHALPSLPSKFITVYQTYDHDKIIRASIWALSTLYESCAEGQLKPHFVDHLPFVDISCFNAFSVAPCETSSKLAMVCNLKSNSSTNTSIPTTGTSPNLLIAEAGVNSCDYKITHSIPIPLPSCSSSVRITSGLNSNINAISWSPHKGCSSLGLAIDTCVLGLDIRSAKSTFLLSCDAFVRCLDFNPNQDQILVTGTDDGFVSLWDLRFLTENALQTSQQSSVVQTPEFNPATANINSWLQHHQHYRLYHSPSHYHWVWSVKFHSIRDEFVLSSGSDHRVCLHNFSNNGEEIKANSMKQGVIAASGDSHTDSVYMSTWSSVDPWTFASVSYDGNVFISHISEEIKLAALLQEDETLLEDEEKIRFAEQDEVSN